MKQEGFRVQNKAGETEIWIYDDIGAGFFSEGVTAKHVARALKEAPKENSILVRINSPGGDVFDGLAIYNLLAQSDRKIVTQVDGMAFSAASYIFMAAKTRRIAENGFLMIHEAWMMAVGTADELRARADSLEEITDSIARIYTAGTGRTREEIDEWMRAETFFTVNPDGESVLDAIAMGFATESIENLKIAAKFDPKRHNIKHVPKALERLKASGGERAHSLAATMQKRVTERRLTA